MSEVLRSARIETLRRQVDAGDDGAVEAFWRGVTAEGTPLIEPLPGDDGHVLVTFVWREGSSSGEPVPLRTVVVLSRFNGFGDFHTHQMQRLPGTNVWHRSYRVRTDVRTTYWLSPNDALLSFCVPATGRSMTCPRP